MKSRLIIFALFAFLCAGTISCSKDLDLKHNTDVSVDDVFTNAASYKTQLAKVYASFALTSSSGSGSSDLGGIDPGTSDFIRLYWTAQELPTDEVACAWLTNDGIPAMDYGTWDANNVNLKGLYTRSIYQITVANDFLKNSTDATLSGKGITGDSLTMVHQYRMEARFLRAYQYWVLMDLFGNPPFVDENSPIGSTAPEQIKRADLFNYVESELLDIQDSLVAPRQNEYGRADQAACWALLARLYLNAKVYTGTERYTDAVTYSQKVIDAGFSLKSNYAQLFMADNNLNNPEVILSVNYDGLNSQNYGGTTYIINAAVNADMNPTNFGIPSGGWGGNRSRSPLPKAFGDYSGNTDKRAMFYDPSNGTLDISDMSVFKQGLAVTKFTNMTSAGEAAASVGGTYCSTDFPLFRLAEAYLIYDEAVLRGGTGGSTGQALQYFNILRQRAYGNNSGNVTSISLNDVLNERLRELYWEGFRRTDLIRYGLFSGDSYVWPYKGGSASGQSIASYRDLYPLPASDLKVNTNLTQNTGY